MQNLRACVVCSAELQNTWVACPYCGWHSSNLLDPNLSIIELADHVYGSGCSNQCGKKSKKNEIQMLWQNQKEKEKSL
jgi:hypothetical protein